MEKLLNIAKAFLQSIRIIFIKASDFEVDYDPELYTPFTVTVTNPNNNKSFTCGTLIDNIFINKKNNVGIYTKYNFLMEVILDYLYKIDDNPYVRNEFSKIFNIEEIKLLIEYFNHFPSFKKAIRELEDG